MDNELKTSVDLSDQNIHWQQDMSYGTYLSLEPLLECQHPVSDSHDEMLFIIIHQASELWLKLCLHELSGAMTHLKDGDLGAVFKMLSRVARIQAQLEQSWNVLSTLTPADYAAFRDQLGQSSGFQSFQYRELEYAIGNKNAKMAEVHRSNPARFEHLQKVLNRESFYDLCLQTLATRGFDIPADKLSRNWSEPYIACAEVEAAWIKVYANTEKYWDLYELAEKLVDLEHHFHSWRFSHMKVVERIIGFKRGTGGTAGVSYLQKALELRFFPELWTARTKI